MTAPSAAARQPGSQPGRPGRAGGPGRTRGPRRRLSEEERRGQILRATFLVVARYGLEGASANRIAEQAGVSKGLIWHYFADKTDLMKQALMAAMTSLGDELAGQVDPAAPAPGLIRTHLRWIAAWARNHQDEYRAMDEIGRKLHAPGGEAAFSVRDYERIYASREEAYRRAQEAGTFRPFNTRVMAVTYQAAVDAMLSYLDTHPDVDTGGYADALADILLAAMETSPAQ